AKEEKEKIDQLVSHILESMGQKLDGLLNNATAHQKNMQEQSVQLALSLVRKLLPTLSQKGALDEVEKMITECLTEAFDEPRIVIRVHDNLLDSLKEKIDTLTASRGFTGKIVLLAEPTITHEGDCRIEWADGGVERNTQKTWQDIEKIAARALAFNKEENGVTEDLQTEDFSEEKPEEPTIEEPTQEEDPEQHTEQS